MMEGGEGGSRGQGCVYTQLTHVAGQQKPTQHGKVIILHLKINFQKYRLFSLNIHYCINSFRCVFNYSVKTMFRNVIL